VESGAELGRATRAIVVAVAPSAWVAAQAVLRKGIGLQNFALLTAPAAMTPHMSRRGADYPIGHVALDRTRNSEAFCVFIADGKLNLHRCLPTAFRWNKPRVPMT